MKKTLCIKIVCRSKYPVRIEREIRNCLNWTDAKIFLVLIEAGFLSQPSRISLSHLWLSEENSLNRVITLISSSLDNSYHVLSVCMYLNRTFLTCLYVFKMHPTKSRTALLKISNSNCTLEFLSTGFRFFFTIISFYSNL